jgi:hypothetical protein
MPQRGFCLPARSRPCAGTTALTRRAPVAAGHAPVPHGPSSRPERSAGICSSLNQKPVRTEAPTLPLSSRPERTRISCCAAVDRSACAAFRKESRMKFANATKPNRKSGVAQWRDLQFSQPATSSDRSTNPPFVIPSKRLACGKLRAK